MIHSVDLKNFGPISHLKIEDCGRINLLIGPNRSGKTLLLKLLYCAQRTVEMTGRGKNPSSDKEILANKLYWTFQVEKLGQLVRRPESEPFRFEMTETNGDSFSFGFGPDTEKKIVRLDNSLKPRLSNSIFIPAKEILSLLDIIKTNREVRMEFGFDETYYDLATALTPPTQGKIAKVFLEVRNRLESALGGRVVYSKEKQLWQYVQGKNVFDINITSEGTKKIGIFDTLIGNHFLTRDSIVFIDEPESGLHPSVLIELLDIIGLLSCYGMQFFIASHSYFVIKKLYLLAHTMHVSIPVISFDSEGGSYVNDLLNDMPDNPIIDQSIKLYEEELEL
ncbi:MAG: ATP-binding protein [Muribaculaceae bacterium]|nr:ATP-binding protein [Muribaculaceae bacterium]